MRFFENTLIPMGNRDKINIEYKKKKNKNTLVCRIKIWLEIHFIPKNVIMLRFNKSRIRVQSG